MFQKAEKSTKKQSGNKVETKQLFMIFEISFVYYLIWGCVSQPTPFPFLLLNSYGQDVSLMLAKMTKLVVLYCVADYWSEKNFIWNTHTSVYWLSVHLYMVKTVGDSLSTN